MAKLRSKSKLYQEIDGKPSQGGIGFSPEKASEMVRSLYINENKLNQGGKGLILNGSIVEATFDEAQILRILRTKGVRGIRVYLALSDRKYNKAIDECEEVPLHLSFVLVGIDENGKDNVLEFDSGKKFLVTCECGGNCERCPPVVNTEVSDSALKMILSGQKFNGIDTDLRLLEF